MPEPDSLIDMTAEIVAAVVANNKVEAAELSTLIETVHSALANVGTPLEAPSQAKPEPAVSVRKSLADPAKIISMIDGKPYTSLKRHIGRHGYTPESYRETFGLKSDYPMVAPAYSERRRQVAKELGLGRRPSSAESEGPVKKARKTLKLALGKAKEHLGG